MRTQIATLTSQLAELQNNPPVATPLVEKKFNKKVGVVADPGAFEGDRARFAEWWIKLQIWVKANWDAFADDFEVATVVLSRLKGPVAGQYAQQIRSFKQGNMRTDDYITWFLALSIQGGLGNEHAVELLEHNVNPRIAEQIYLQDTRNENLALAAEEVAGPPPKTTNPRGAPGHQTNINILTGSSRSGCNQGRAPMDIGAVQGGQMRRFQGNCYNCSQEGHMSQDCRKGVQAAQQKNNQGRQARQLESKKPDNWLNSLAGCSYDEIRAFFYDQQVAEMKTQGKEFGA
ncbi:hypothetical protein SERLA73DRAFT_71963 [Serpula lacrymans var. lacrymans S7.3]|uniref:CCHC-type domain-containing protein n=2 Tax=Serpula lacrymans var. lacrymans TaxID=341189 RepID=F8PTG8_SERL3|nr:uncharacterized protein SERLADRAFT_436440 [Serpula lacrymans var. lacrymans S7.9]EGO00996.1 hypothetical protein SERLA73DRAFT_71963 [Serpula lacrymans var. lacrymans S7.3]EGO26629.1 hypothetical protein SERLADRAFT_436440 [Serpula lacrymans var. lacrymans S7.9]